jgi:hypothetical protein
MSIPADHLTRLQAAGVLEQEPPAPAVEEPTAREPEITKVDLELAAQKARADTLQQQLQAQQSAPPTVQQVPQPQEPDWDHMTTKDIIQTVIGEVRRGQDQVRNDLAVEIVKLRLEQQLTAAAEQYPDFMDYSDDVVRISQEKKGTVTPAEAYLLAKARRHQNASPQRRAAAPTDSGQRPGTAGPKAAPPPKNMRDAAETAYRQVFGVKR